MNDYKKIVSLTKAALPAAAVPAHIRATLHLAAEKEARRRRAWHVGLRIYTPIAAAFIVVAGVFFSSPIFDGVREKVDDGARLAEAGSVIAAAMLDSDGVYDDFGTSLDVFYDFGE